jgi:hypothetical protein
MATAMILLLCLVDRRSNALTVVRTAMSALNRRSHPRGELAAGLAEMRVRYPQGELRFVDRFEFVLGVR